MQSVGSRLLRDIVESGGEWTQASLAREFGVTRQAVKQWLDGDAKPKGKRMAKIEDRLGIPMRAWTESRARRTGTEG